MLGYLFMKYQTECRELDSALVLCEEANGWIMLFKSKDALMELRPTKAAEDKEVKL